MAERVGELLSAVATLANVTPQRRNSELRCIRYYSACECQSDTASKLYSFTSPGFFEFLDPGSMVLLKLPKEWFD
jgi:hypothetical protein